MENKVCSRILASSLHRISSERSKQGYGTHKERADEKPRGNMDSELERKQMNEKN